MDETVLATEEATDPVAEPVTSPDETEAFESEPSSVPAETEAAATGDGSVTEETYEISETVAYLPTEDFVLEDGTEATEETVSITLVDLQAVGSDIVHADLFGSFLICGTLIGLALLRKVYGT